MQIYYSDHISWQLLCNKVYIINEITQRIHVLEDVGKDFWLLIKDNNSLKEINIKLSELYNVSNDIITVDINEFKDMLISRKLLTKGDY